MPSTDSLLMRLLLIACSSVRNFCDLEGSLLYYPLGQAAFEKNLNLGEKKNPAVSQSFEKRIFWESLVLSSTFQYVSFLRKL